MDEIAVVARAFNGEPLLRLAIYAQEHMVYLANPDLLELVRSGDSIPVGFPVEDVFLYNSDAYENIRTKWVQHGDVSRETWDDYRIRHPLGRL